MGDLDESVGKHWYGLDGSMSTGHDEKPQERYRNGDDAIHDEKP